MNEVRIKKDRHILIAVDESDNSRRALLYAADFMGGVPRVRATIVSIIPEPPEDYFEDDRARNVWLEEKQTAVRQMLSSYAEILVQAGFRPKKVDTVIEVRKCPSVAACILDVQKRLECCTVIVGRRVLSRKEEFLFGSTSSKLLHTAQSCAVWVVE